MFLDTWAGTKIWLQMYQMCWQLWERKLIIYTERAYKWIEENCGIDYRTYLRCALGLIIGRIVLESVW